MGPSKGFIGVIEGYLGSYRIGFIGFRDIIGL